MGCISTSARQGQKFWRQKYRYNGVEKLLTHGKYPIVSLADARKLRDAAIKLLSDSTDPSKAKRQSKARLSNTFGAIAKEWFDRQSINWKPIHSDKVWRRMDVDTHSNPIARYNKTMHGSLSKH